LPINQCVNKKENREKLTETIFFYYAYHIIFIKEVEVLEAGCFCFSDKEVANLVNLVD